MKTQILALLFLVLILSPSHAIHRKRQNPMKPSRRMMMSPKQFAQMKMTSRSTHGHGGEHPEDYHMTVEECIDNYEECKGFSDEVFAEFDSDGNEFIDASEFSYVATYISGIFLLPLPSDEEIQQVIDIIDLDVSGTIDCDEFFSIFLAILAEMSGCGEGPGHGNGGHGGHQGGHGGQGGGHGGQGGQGGAAAGGDGLSKRPTHQKVQQQQRMLNHTFSQMKNRMRAKQDPEGYVPSSVDDCFDNYPMCQGYSDSIFDMYDEDNSGYISRAEFSYVATYVQGALNESDPLSPAEVDQIFNEVDWDGSGDIDKEEFFKLVLVILDELDAQSWSP